MSGSVAGIGSIAFMKLDYKTSRVAHCRWVVNMGTGEGEVGLRRLGRALYEAAGLFYADDARRRLAVHAERRNPSPAISARTAFKACPSFLKPVLPVDLALGTAGVTASRRHMSA